VTRTNFLIRFSVSGVGTRTDQSAKLRLHGVDPSDHGGDFRALADPTATWTEQTVDWDNATAAASTVGTLGSVCSGSWYEVDLSSFVTGGGDVHPASDHAVLDRDDDSSKEARMRLSSRSWSANRGKAVA
jgi:hypothetical protein